jgi:two-component system NtrC family sensor kinase
VKLITALQEGLPTIQASMSELQQVFLNLINNALDAMEKKGGTIKLTTQAKDNLIKVSIEDDGPGIPKANLERIFDPFFTTKPMGKGTGLGLSICYGIVNKMGGEIEVKSSAGVGTLFNIRIPVTRQTDQKPSDGTERKWQDIPKGEANG